MSSGNRSHIRRAINPAFAVAHGLTESVQGEIVGLSELKQNGSGTDSKDAGTRVKNGPTPRHRRLEVALQEARRTGKMQVVNLGLTTPLPEEIFDLRAGIPVNLSMGKTSSSSNSECGSAETSFVYGEDMLTLVDFSDNDFSGSATVDERILRYENVQTFRCKRCNIAQLTTNLTPLEHLMVLDLSGNAMQSFRLDWLPSALQTLDLSQNNLQNIISNGANLSQMKSIDLSSNHLKDLTALYQIQWQRLISFQCSKNPLKALHVHEILNSANTTLQAIDASYCQLQGEKMNFSAFEQLQTITLSFNRIATVPMVPSSVIRLDLTSNKIDSIEDMFTTSEDVNMVDLLLQDNHLIDLHVRTIIKCTNIQRLDLSANKLKTLPYELGFLHRLQHLSLTGNPLYTFKTSEIENSKLILEKLQKRTPKENAGIMSNSRLLSSSTIVQQKSIHLTERRDVDLKQLTQELKSNPSLAFDIDGKLTLDKNDLEVIPDDLLPLLPNLAEVSFIKNRFKLLPPSLLRSCPKLSHINISGNEVNRIFDIPHSLDVEIPWATALVRLDLSSNCLLDFPAIFLQQLSSLQHLNLSFNKMKSTNGWFILPKTLTHLNLSENSLENVDDLVLLVGAFSPRMEALFLQHNRISRIPSITGLLNEKCPNLQVLDLKGNPQRSIRPEILAKATPDQLAYFKNRLTKDQKIAALTEIDMLLQSGGKPNDKDLAATPVEIPILDSTQHISTDKPQLKPEISLAEVSESKKDAAVAPESNSVLRSFQEKIGKFEKELDNPSLSQAKRYALKKNLAMERSKLIREERRLGLRP